MTGMYADEHSGHTTCGAPGCTSFHLFCPDCGGRRHVGDSLITAAPPLAADGRTDGLPSPVELTVAAGRDEYRLAGS